jgi:hypothetical protein
MNSHLLGREIKTPRDFDLVGTPSAGSGRRNKQGQATTTRAAQGKRETGRKRKQYTQLYKKLTVDGKRGVLKTRKETTPKLSEAPQPLRRPRHLHKQGQRHCPHLKKIRVRKREISLALA